MTVYRPHGTRVQPSPVVLLLVANMTISAIDQQDKAREARVITNTKITISTMKRALPKRTKHNKTIRHTHIHLSYLNDIHISLQVKACL